MGKNPPKWLPGERVNETILLQRKSVEQLRADRILRKDKLTETRKKRKDKIDAKRKRKLSTKKFISAQSILKYAQRERHQARKYHKIGEKSTNREKLLGPERMAKQYKASGIALLVRSKGNLVPKDVEESFRKLGLSKMYSARLIAISQATSVVLKQLRPFSILGYPSPLQVEQLIRTRGCLWNEETQSKKYLSGNRLIEEAFGQYNILCVEDLAASIANKVDNIEAILKLLAPFDFHPPHQLFMERHRTAHQKLEIINPESFAAYIQQQIGETMKATAKENKKKVKDAEKHQKRIAIANAKMALSKKEDTENARKEDNLQEDIPTSPTESDIIVTLGTLSIPDTDDVDVTADDHDNSEYIPSLEAPKLNVTDSHSSPSRNTVGSKKEGKTPPTKAAPKPKTTPKKISPKMASPKKISPKMTSPKKISPKMTTPKKISPKMATPKKKSPKMATPKKIAAKKETPKKSTPRKIVPKSA